MPPRKKDQLTAKEKLMVKKYTDPTSDTFLNGSKSHQQAYGSSVDVSHTEGSKVLARPQVKRTLKEILDDTDIWEDAVKGLESCIQQGRNSEDYKDRTIMQKAIQILADIQGVRQPQQHLHVNVTPEDREEEYAKIVEMVKGAEKEAEEA